jgi:predicted lactoylglutathione lyase
MDLSRGEIGLSVKDLDSEIKFFEQLGFKESANQADNPGPHKIMTDGRIFIGLYQFDFPSPTVGIYCDDIQSDVNEIAKSGLELEQFADSNGSLEAAQAVSPAGVPFFLQPASVFEQPDREEPFSKAGLFGELAIPVKEFEAEVSFWQQVGFEFAGGPYDDPEKWGILGNRTLPVGIHETTHYDQPALTFFSTHQSDMISELKESGTEFQWSMENEDGVTENAALLTPNGILVFLFTGDLSEF